MKVEAIAACAFAALLRVATAQFVEAPSDLISTTANGYTVRYKEVPSGICETVEGVKSYSGYIDVAEDEHLFFWFFEARSEDPKESPLTLWLNGGPGDPSLVGLFSGNGPCSIDYDGKVQYNQYSWNNASNMLFLDQPTSTGLSYSIPVNAYTSESGDIISLPDAVCPDSAPANTCGTLSSSNASLTANSTPNAAPNVYRALQGFMGAFPDYASNGFHISTESYGGHYGPIFADYILEQNAKNHADTAYIDLRGLSVGNGWFDPIIQFQAYYNFTVSPGNTYGFKPFNTSMETQMYNALYGKGKCLDQLLDCNAHGIDSVCSAADTFCYDQVESLYDTVTGRDEYDLRELMPDPFPPTHFVAYLNKPEIQKALGAYTNFSYSTTNLGSGTVATAFSSTGDDARTFDIINITKSLIERGVYVVHYAGDADYNCNWLGIQAFASLITPPSSPLPGYENLTTPSSSSSSSNSIHGVSKQSDNYSFVRIYDSGHQVPFYKPKAALAVFERMLRRVDIATGVEGIEGYRSVGPVESGYRNDAGTIQEAVVDGRCEFDQVRNVPVCDLEGGGRRRRRRWDR